MIYSISDYVVTLTPDRSRFAVCEAQGGGGTPEIPFKSVGQSDIVQELGPLIAIDLLPDGDTTKTKFKIVEVNEPPAPRSAEFDLVNGPYYFQCKVGLGVADIRDGALTPISNLNNPSLSNFGAELSESPADGVLVAYGSFPELPPSAGIIKDGDIWTFNRRLFEIELDLQSRSFIIVDRSTSDVPLDFYTQGIIQIVGENYVLNTRPEMTPSRSESASWDIIRNAIIRNGAIFMAYDAPNGRFVSVWDLFRGQKVFMDSTGGTVNFSVFSNNPLDFLKINYLDDLNT